MASVGTYIAEWFRQRLSSVVTVQKQFVDDVTEKVKEQKAQFDRHERDAHDRAIQLHLDSLEEKYLCCVCGRGGEAREDDEFVYDTYSMVELPPRLNLEAAVREELADAEMTDERIKQHQREIAVRQQRTGSYAMTTQMPASQQYNDDDDDLDASTPGAAAAKAKAGRHPVTAEKARRQRHPAAQRRASTPAAARLQQREENEEDGDDNGNAKRTRANSASATTSPTTTFAHHRGRETAPGENRPGELAVMNPDMVGPLEVRNTLYKIRHAVLHKEARTRRKAVAVHKDKGLMKIEESEIDMFSHFFQRPVHGYLCNACYTSARRRLDALTQQIRGILFKAQNPVLRRVPSKEVEALSSGSQVPAVLIDSILTVQRRWAAMTEEERMLIRGAEATAQAVQTPAAAFEAEERSMWTAQVDGEKVVMSALPEKCILLLREQAKCAACQRRLACFFEQRSVAFLCQFCTARDRFYREHAICINDEAMPLDLVHMLQEFASYYQALQQQMEIRGARQSAIELAQTDLFPLTEVLREKGGLFACQAPAAANNSIQKLRDTVSIDPNFTGAASELEAQMAEVSMAAPSTYAATNRLAASAPVPLSELRERVGRTMVSLFDGVKVKSNGVNLFANAPQSTNNAKGGSAVGDLFAASPAPPQPQQPPQQRPSSESHQQTSSTTANAPTPAPNANDSKARAPQPVVDTRNKDTNDLFSFAATASASDRTSPISLTPSPAPQSTNVWDSGAPGSTSGRPANNGAAAPLQAPVPAAGNSNNNSSATQPGGRSPDWDNLF